jgi:hypothetical protein
MYSLKCIVALLSLLGYSTPMAMLVFVGAVVSSLQVNYSIGAIVEEVYLVVVSIVSQSSQNNPLAPVLFFLY